MCESVFPDCDPQSAICLKSSYKSSLISSGSITLCKRGFISVCFCFFEFCPLLCLSITYWLQPSTSNPSLSLFFPPSHLLVFSESVGAAGSSASPLHPPILPAERGGQRGADQVVGGVSRSGQRGQAISHAAPRTTRDADNQDPTEALCWYKQITHKQRYTYVHYLWLESKVAVIRSATHQCTWPRTHWQDPCTHPHTYIVHILLQQDDREVRPPQGDLDMPQNCIDFSPELESNDLVLHNVFHTTTQNA